MATVWGSGDTEVLQSVEIADSGRAQSALKPFANPNLEHPTILTSTAGDMLHVIIGREMVYTKFDAHNLHVVACFEMSRIKDVIPTLERMSKTREPQTSRSSTRVCE
jgi:hypothetical protein